MFFDSKADKDGTITNLVINGTSKTGSNSGQSEILELYALTRSTSRVGKSRILIRFDLDSLSASIAEDDIPTSSVEYRLKLKNAVHADSVPYSYDLEVYPLSKSWDEGRGLSMEDENLKDSGVANWVNATSQTPWDSAGGDFYASPTVSRHFDFGTEDLDIDISNIVYAWLTGGVPNNGLLVKYKDFFETGSADQRVKKFFSRHALVPERRPRIQALWENHLQDDRSEFPYEYTGTLAYYRFIGGSPNSINEDIFVDIINSSSAVTQTLTASLVESGIYEISGVFIEPSAGTDIFRDVWFTSTKQLFTGTIEPVYVTGSQVLNFDGISIGIPNLKSTYGSDEEIIVRVFATKKDYRPAVVQRGSLEPDPLLLKEAFFQIENAETKEVIVPFSTGSFKFSKLSYDFEGNYFKMWTKSLDPDSVYKIKILANYNEKRYIFDRGWKITVRD